jgi:hypothetical protein
VKLVTAPDRRGNVGRQREQPAGAARIDAEATRALDGIGRIRDLAVAPAADLVSEEAESAGRTDSHRPLGNDATRGGIPISHRRLFDHEAGLRQPHLERRVIQIAPISALESGDNCLEDQSVEPDRVATRPERQPVQVDRGCSALHAVEPRPEAGTVHRRGP